METLAAVKEVKADQLQLMETLAAVEEVKAYRLQLVETLAAVEEVRAAGGNSGSSGGGQSRPTAAG